MSSKKYLFIYTSSCCNFIDILNLVNVVSLAVLLLYNFLYTVILVFWNWYDYVIWMFARQIYVYFFYYFKIQFDLIGVVRDKCWWLLVNSFNFINLLLTFHTMHNRAERGDFWASHGGTFRRDRNHGGRTKVASFAKTKVSK